MMGDFEEFHKFLIIAPMHHIFSTLRQAFSSFSSRLVFFGSFATCECESNGIGQRTKRKSLIDWWLHFSGNGRARWPINTNQYYDIFNLFLGHSRSPRWEPAHVVPIMVSLLQLVCSKNFSHSDGMPCHPIKNVFIFEWIGMKSAKLSWKVLGINDA